MIVNKKRRDLGFNYLRFYCSHREKGSLELDQSIDLQRDGRFTCVSSDRKDKLCLFYL